MPRDHYAALPTERRDPRTARLDELDSRALARVMRRADEEAVRAVGRAEDAVSRGIDRLAAALRRGGRIVFAGAGTSGRLGVLEAAECPPTFGLSPSRVQALMAGGRRAVFRSREGAEDDARDAVRQIRARVRRGDLVVGVAASGVTPFVRAALRDARARGADTVLVTCNPQVSRRAARLVIVLDTGPEVLAGSTRLKAGTATKLVLNALTTGACVRAGLVYGNRMVDLQPRSAKLRRRAVRLIGELGRVDARAAARLLATAGGRAKVAIAMARLDIDARAARRRLRAAHERLADLIGPA